ncbi:MULTISPECIES: MaoC family dehydratase [Oceanicaulis]|mgnify:FL=1|jgi:3-hydroxybutyryl-CoA dehydratase|uniref:MaoC family dehydratase n=1 Tax=Oceanicaulis TaxID=153232 RepID=UPI0003B38717|nr:MULTISPECIES: MaoC family dehydratase [Oceanicaulis]MBL4538404.1 MaoC family dehydratase [Oceanicaulis sp.]VXC69301.1 3-hydroxybutyryl-CoA dehydratase [Oceanicaulis sp. 350]HCR66609.1 (R)-hydratase [Oceanicaulis sp.]|tara:strand:+ start:4838 stop:5278 length:441 start_codon:yes stop_codon:yes gene_type:complete
MSDFEGYGINELEVGQSAEITRLVDDNTVKQFAEVSGDFNPLHMDEAYAARSPFRGRIAHGALVASFISCVLGNHLPGPGAVFAGMTMRFERPVRIGDTVIARATVTEVDIKARRVKLACVCEVEGQTCMEADAEVIVRKRRKSTA